MKIIYLWRWMLNASLTEEESTFYRDLYSQILEKTYLYDE